MRARGSIIANDMDNVAGANGCDMEPRYGLGWDEWDPTSRTTAVVCGDPVVGQALVLLLRSHCLDVKFLSASALVEREALSGVRLLLLAPTHGLSAADSERFLATIKAAGSMGVTLLELVTGLEAGDEKKRQIGRAYPVPWPCSTEELRRHVDLALSGREGSPKGRGKG